MEQQLSRSLSRLETQDIKTQPQFNHDLDFFWHFISILLSTNSFDFSLESSSSFSLNSLSPLLSCFWRTGLNVGAPAEGKWKKNSCWQDEMKFEKKREGHKRLTVYKMTGGWQVPKFISCSSSAFWLSSRLIRLMRRSQGIHNILSLALQESIRLLDWFAVWLLLASWKLFPRDLAEEIE